MGARSDKSSKGLKGHFGIKCNWALGRLLEYGGGAAGAMPTPSSVFVPLVGTVLGPFLAIWGV